MWYEDSVKKKIPQNTTKRMQRPKHAQAPNSRHANACSKQVHQRVAIKAEAFGSVWSHNRFNRVVLKKELTLIQLNPKLYLHFIVKVYSFLVELENINNTILMAD